VIEKVPLANPTRVSSLEISKRTISPENTRSYQPGKTETNRKKLSPSEKKKNLNGGVAILLKKSLLVNLITFLAYYSTCSRSANIVISTY
jgi:hypothetical protein